MSIQQKIDDHLNDELHKCGVILIENESGSASVPEEIDITFRNCSGLDVTADGKNNICIVDCDDASVEITDGQLRFTKCSSIQKIKATGSKVNVGEDAEIQELDLTNCEATLINIKSQQAKLSNCEFHSIKGKFQKLQVDACKWHSEEDESQDLQITGRSSVIAFQHQAQKLQLEESFVTAEKMQAEQEVTITDSRLIDVDGEYQQQFTASGDKTILSLKATEFQQECTISDGVVGGSNPQFMQQVTFDSCKIKLNTPTFEQEATFTTCTDVVLVAPEFQQAVTFEDGAARIEEGTFNQAFTFSSGSLKTRKCEFQQAFTANDVTLDSSGDKFQQAVLITTVGPFSRLYKPKFEEMVGITGSDTNNIEIHEADGSAAICTMTKFGRVQIAGGELQQLLVEDVAQMLVDQTTLEQASFDSINFLDTCTADIQTILLVNQVSLWLSAAHEEITSCMNSTVLDEDSQFISIEGAILLGRGSTLEAATACNLILKDADATGIVGGVVQATGGNLAGVAFVATVEGTECENPTGLTSGMGFTWETQGGSILYDGDLNCMCTTGNVINESLIADVIQLAPAGNILSTAAMSITGVAGLAVDYTAGTNIVLTSGVNYTLTVGGESSVTVTGNADYTAAATQISSSGTTLIQGTSVDVLAGTISITGFVTFS